MEKLSDMRIHEFSALLGSEAPAPGGGSAAALLGALGASLCAMVSRLTVGKPAYAAQQQLATETAQKADALRNRLLEAIDRDTDAFNALSAAFSMPKETDERKKRRSESIQSALLGCTESPLAIMRLCLEALELTAGLTGRSNASAASDLGVSALCLKAGMQGAWLNVLINLGSLKDDGKAGAYRAEAEAILERSIALADACYAHILASLT